MRGQHDHVGFRRCSDRRHATNASRVYGGRICSSALGSAAASGGRCDGARGSRYNGSRSNRVEMSMTLDSVGIIGGCGHAGLPLGLSLAKAGHDVTLYDIDKRALAMLAEGRMPFQELGAEEVLARHLGKNLHVSNVPSVLTNKDVVVCIVGTPIDEYLNPQVQRLLSLVDELATHLNDQQLFVLRSTLYPGATARVHEQLSRVLPGIDVAFCPERIVQGNGLAEIGSLPQIVSGMTDSALVRARRLFESICKTVIELTPMEAELGKLFCNAWRYIAFGVANQFYSVCAENDIDYYRVRRAIVQDYPRMAGLPLAGFAAGPCLFKDTMQLSAFFPNDFPLGQSAMLVNEQMPRTVIRQLMRHTDIKNKAVGILGMAFKGDSDDVRDSLAFKLRKLLIVEGARPLCTDPFVQLPWLERLDEVLSEADLLVIAAPHQCYAELKPRQPIVDVWNLLRLGGLLQSGAPAEASSGRDSPAHRTGRK